MNYRPLSKFYYARDGSYEQVYEARFHSESACHLDFQIGDSPAFFLITEETTTLLSSIYKADKRLTQLRHNLPPVAIQQFTVNSLIDEIILTNSIEGVHSTRREIETVLNTLQRNDTRKRFQGLVQKYTLLQTSAVLPLQTPADIRSIYNELCLEEVRQEDPANVPDGLLFRTDTSYVTSSTQKVLHTGVAPESRIITCMEQALAFLRQDSPGLLLRLAIFHYLFGYIHPFYDGNGRTSRFISSYLLAQELDPLVGYRLSYTIKESIHAYYRAFRTCNDRKNLGDLTPFLLTFLSILAQSVQQLAQALEERLQRLGYYAARCRELLPQDRHQASLSDLLLQASLFGGKGIPADELCAALGITRPTLTYRLRAISPPELLTVVTEDHRKYYSLNLALLDSLTEPPKP